EQMGADHRFDDFFTRSDAGLERFEGLLEPQAVDGIATIEPVAERTEEIGDAARIASGVALAQLEFEGVQGRFDGGFVDAMLGEAGEGIEYKRLDLVR